MSCTAGSCPTVYEDGPDSVLVQGYVVPAPRLGFSVPEGEAVVKVPIELLRSAAASGLT